MEDLAGQLMILFLKNKNVKMIYISFGKVQWVFRPISIKGASRKHITRKRRLRGTGHPGHCKDI